MQTTNQANKKPLPKWAVALIIIGVTLMVGVIGTLLGGKMRDGYRQPFGMAPDWLFPVAWTINYIAIGIAAWLTYVSNRDLARRRNDFIWYGIHLFFNMLWPLFFFRLDLVIFAAIWLIFNILSAFTVTCRFYKSNLAAGIIFTVYQFWLLYALYLNLGIMMLN